MKTKQVQLSNGRVYTVGFDFATLCEYEEQFGQSLDINDLDTAPKTMRLVWASIASFNDDAPSYKDFRHLSAEDYSLLMNTVMECMVDFYKLPVGQQTDAVQEQDTEDANP